ncbi:peroxisomal acyl-CoA oxidase (macronuclear) [Tetrahymena thermophila SB210]|uniref:Acyl-coenzyme A oxidase n=1 Tax=Tetrahymena thermophila (strain SB210) TaxID=312017 RepID=I7MAJ3_TETTS|nr:peroxisomal acyl-CoA oxidase [Tetrahymena thermophila SB210]EAS04704.1 peroxisomal acyl-CoA oxidase [Tetrahymena thermophila SB210]|eukprot:XP_001024949.1 peroxisomal acyl-CoA oxidase [Tetrahymena thermophila SB210]
MSQANERIETLTKQVKESTLIADELNPKKSLEFYRQKSTICPKQVENTIYGYNSHYMKRVYEVIKNSPQIFRHPHLEEWSREVYRYMSFRQLVQFDKEKNMSYEDYKKDPHIATIMGTALYQWNASHCIKHGVHFYLYAKTIINLGTQKHEKYVQRSIDLSDVGSFSLTELGHGSNVRSILTTATYDTATNEFIINTPNDLALKWWIGATAQLANQTVVWAQLLLNGENHGVHAFLVPIRSLEDHQPMPGVVIGDCGSKVGLDGIDNGFLQFTNYRVPYDSLLDKFSQIEDGKFKTSIPSADRRFGLQLGSLSGGRIVISMHAGSNAMMALTIATRYACIRKQFGLPGQPENSIIEYPLVQYRLMSSLAKYAVQQVAALNLNQLWDHNQENVLDLKNNLINQLHAQSSVMKAICSWQAKDIIQISREILGGHGYSSYNRIGMLYRDNDINITWEGDNNVLLQQTSKFLLDAARTLMKGKEIKYPTIKFLTVEPVEGQKWDAKEVAQFRNPENILRAMEWRVNLLLQRSGLKLQENLGSHPDPFAAWNGTQVFYLNSLALAYGEVYQAQEFISALNKIHHEQTKEFMLNLFELWGLNIIINDLGTFREGDFVESDTAKQMKDRVVELIKALKDEAIGFLDVVCPPDHILGSPFGAKDGDIYNKYLTYVRGAKNSYSRVDWWNEIHPKKQ